MERNKRIYVAGHNGMVGSALVRSLKKSGYTNIIGKSTSTLDLTRQNEVEEFFTQEKPDVVFIAAAKVGGINANNTYSAEFIYINMMIEANIIHSAYKAGIENLLFLGSGCIYPRVCNQPIKEEYLLTSELEKTNEAYAVAKIAGLKLCEFYNKQYGTKYFSVMPCNLFGEGDNYNLSTSHVIPALIRKFHEAKLNNHSNVMLWGTGAALREFMYIDDMADACIFLMEQQSLSLDLINIGVGYDVSIFEIAKAIQKIVGYTGDICFDTSKPDGAPKRLLDSSKINDFGWKPTITLEEGLKRTYEDYLKNKDNLRS